MYFESPRCTKNKIIYNKSWTTKTLYEEFKKNFPDYQKSSIKHILHLVFSICLTPSDIL